MDYQEYKRDFLEMLRNDSAISGSDTEDEFLNHTLDILSDFDEVNDPVRLGMGDKRGRGGRLMRADGYCFDETDHSLVMFISDFQDSFETDKLTMTRVDELYWRLYYFLDESVNGNISDYFDDSDDIIKVSRLIRNRLNVAGDNPDLILKIKFFIILYYQDVDSLVYWANEAAYRWKLRGMCMWSLGQEDLRLWEWLPKQIE